MRMRVATSVKVRQKYAVLTRRTQRRAREEDRLCVRGIRVEERHTQRWPLPACRARREGPSMRAPRSFCRKGRTLGRTHTHFYVRNCVHTRFSRLETISGSITFDYLSIDIKFALIKSRETLSLKYMNLFSAHF